VSALNTSTGRESELSRGQAQLVRQPANVANVEPGEVRRVVEEALSITTGIVPSVDGHMIKRLAVGVVEEICAGRAARGLKLERLLKATRVGTGHTREHLFTNDLTTLADLTIRLLLAASKQRGAYEQVHVTWAKTGRERNSMGTDRVKNVTPGMRFMALTLGRSDRLVPSLEIPFTTGTRHDRTCHRADPSEIERLTRELGRRPNGSPAEHLSELLDLSEVGRTRAMKSVAGHDHHRFLLDHGFSDLILGTSMRCGPARKRTQWGEYTYAPGRDQDFIDVLRKAGKRGVLHMGTRTARGDDAFSIPVVERQGFRSHGFAYSEFDQDLGNAMEADVSWYWHATAQRLKRVQAGNMRVDDWYVLDLADDLATAVALVRRHTQKWTIECLNRWVRDTGLGLMGVSSYRSDVAVRNLLRIGNAAVVHTDLRARARRDGGWPP
jgi:hypothetical protein